MMAVITMLGLLAGTPPFPEAGRPDVLIADFEGEDYAGWKTSGEAFGEAPARGTLPGQMSVEGYLGRGLVNSYRGGDGATGELTSPPFPITRNHLNFLIGGGGWEGETCLQLLVDGRVVRSAVGPNRRPGGSERLRWHSWDLGDLQGREATLRVVDHRQGGWGHVNVDHIVLTDAPQLPVIPSRGLTMERRYLQIPVKTGEPKVRAAILADGATIREFDVELAPAGAAPDFFAFSDLDGMQGKEITIRVDAPDAAARLAGVAQSDDAVDPATLYHEPHRPRFHFSSRRGWLNDPNGLVFADGEYHLYYQHNPFGWGWGNMHWGHAVSPDLVHWRELPIAIYPREHGDWAFSGSAVIDAENTSGFGRDGKAPLVAAYTSTGRGECIVYSLDGGRSFTEYPGNPVVKHEGRDPRLLWHAPSKRWVMAVYDEGKEPKRQSIDFYTSPDLKTWTFASRIDGFYECPDVFELPVDGDPGRKLWVLYGADAEYLLGDFDGSTFKPTSGADKLKLWHGNFYAAQTFSNEPKGRRVQIGWNREVTFPGSAFNQQMSLPVELTLRTTPDGPRMFAEPVAELQTLRDMVRGPLNGSGVLEPDGENPLKGFAQIPDVGLYELDLAFRPKPGAKFLELGLLGNTLVYDVDRQDVVCGEVRAFVPQVDGLVRLHVFVDRGSIEVFANGGRTAIAAAALASDRSFAIAAKGGAFDVERLLVFRLKSAWESKAR